MKYQDIIENAIRQCETATIDENVIVAFQGIGCKQAASVMASPIALSHGASYANEDGTINLLALNASRTSLLASALQRCGVRIALYEELLMLAPSFSALNTKVVVVKNNLFSGFHAPCCIASNQVKELAESYSAEAVSSEENALQAAAKDLYVDVRYAEGGHAAVTFISPSTYTDEDIEVRDLFELAELPVESTSAYDAFELSKDDIEDYALALVDGAEKQVTLNLSTQIQQDARKLAEGFVGALTRLGIAFDVNWVDPYEWAEEEAVSADGLEMLLKKHWGKEAEFRKIKFYDNPARGKELSDVSQGVIVSKAVQQAENALDEKPYRNMFITAPTGAGKSLLFQLPAVYLARNRGALTIVISPLISLMDDQVRHLVERGITEATYLNSDLSHVERDKRMARVLDGRSSILYLSPEMFLNSGQVSVILESRTLAMVVIDEAHTVTTWGKEFRSDYWFLGDKLRRLKRAGHRFPVMCLTATAVLGGPEDTVNQTIMELNIDNPLVFYGDVKRDNISFDIKTRNSRDFHGSVEEAKCQLASDRIAEYANGGHKALVYCPYRTQTGDVINAASERSDIPYGKVWCYHGGMDADRKAVAAANFATSPAATLVCTKAFGMGVDVKDVERVYHYAPTGGLADYVQEIGRAGRKEGSQAVAAIDFFDNDLRYTRSLTWMNSISTKQLSQIMQKVYEIYLNSGKSRRLLVSPQSFAHLFKDDDCASQFRRAMMILKEDFQNRYGYPLLNVSPQASFARNYVNVPDDSEESFLEKYGAYAKLMHQPRPRELKKGRQNVCITKNMGKIYSVEMDDMWRDLFPDITFPQLKRLFFNKELFDVAGMPIAPRQRLTIKFDDDFETTMDKYEEYLKCVDAVLMGFKTRGKEFTKKDFTKAFMAHVGDGFEYADGLGSVFDFFVSGETFRGANSCLKDSVECVYSHRSSKTFETQYSITRHTYVAVANTLVKDGSACVPNREDFTYETYLPSGGKHGRKKAGFREIRFASLIELFGLGTYEVAGGEDPQMSLRIGNPTALKRAADDSHYRNAVLDNMNDRKNRAAKVIEAFFQTELTDEERWEVIEDYFLGNDQVVNHMLGIQENVD